MNVGTIALTAALATSLAACGSRTEQNQAASENVLPAPMEPTSNMSAGDNISIGNTQAMEMPQPGTPTPSAEPRRTPPAQKAEPSSRPTQPADPHAGHDMGNMMHNQSSSGS